MTLAAYAPAGLILGDALLARIEHAYASPGRAYHSLEHIEAVCRLFADLEREGRWDDPASVFLAVLFHDAVYVPGSRDNEALSAELARVALADDPAGVGVSLDRVAQLVELTARHGSLVPADVDGDAALFLDIDMAILAADEPTFGEYEHGIATEYAFVPPEVYAAGRRAFLEGLLASPRIYLSAVGLARWEGKARVNIERALRAER